VLLGTVLVPSWLWYGMVRVCCLCGGVIVGVVVVIVVVVVFALFGSVKVLRAWFRGVLVWSGLVRSGLVLDYSPPKRCPGPLNALKPLVEPEPEPKPEPEPAVAFAVVPDERSGCDSL